MMDIVMLIGQVGFPIAISIYLLVTRDNIIKTNTLAIERHTDAIENLARVVEELCTKKR